MAMQCEHEQPSLFYLLCGNTRVTLTKIFCWEMAHNAFAALPPKNPLLEINLANGIIGNNGGL